jgi:hypothetical protein
MDWIYLMKVALMASGTLVLLAIAALIIQMVFIAREVGVVVQRVEMITDVRNWIVWAKNIGAFRRIYEKFRH